MIQSSLIYNSQYWLAMKHRFDEAMLDLNTLQHPLSNSQISMIDAVMVWSSDRSVGKGHPIPVFSVVLCKTAVSPVCLQCKYCSLTLGHWYDFSAAWYWKEFCFLNMFDCANPVNVMKCNVELFWLGYAIRRAPILVWPNMGKVGDNRRW